MKTIKKNKIPRYYSLRIFFIAALFYILFTFPFLGTIIMQNVADLKYSINDDGSYSFNIGVGEDNDTKSDTTEYASIFAVDDNTQFKRLTSTISPISDTVKKSGKVLFFVFLITGIPFKIFFILKRRNRAVPKTIDTYCKKTIIYTPIFYSGIVMLAAIITLLYSINISRSTAFDSNFYQKLFNCYAFITCFSLVSVSTYIFSWCKYRVHLIYYDIIFDKKDLITIKKTIIGGSIKRSMAYSIIMSAITPVIIVILYITLCSTNVKELGDITQEQGRVLNGRYGMLGFLPEDDFTFSEVDNESNMMNKYIDVVNYTLLQIGIITSLIIVAIYMFSYIRWTSRMITKPIDEINEKISLVRHGDYEHFSIVRDNDEIGNLAEGFNNLTSELDSHLKYMFKLMEANERFVPTQFIEMLNKFSIAEVKLGDQVAKKMTILFSDIRSFTTISESMTPKDNFDFINTYLGFMEPVITKHNGFIDKYIGDAIMALFENSDDAVLAAVDMRYALIEANKTLKDNYNIEIEIGAGIHSGDLMLGIVGSEYRMASTVISDAVNLASRLESLTKNYKTPILVSKNVVTASKLQDNISYKMLDTVLVKGKTKPVDIYAVLFPSLPLESQIIQG